MSVLIQLFYFLAIAIFNSLDKLFQSFSLVLVQSIHTSFLGLKAQTSEASAVYFFVVFVG